MEGRQLSRIPKMMIGERLRAVREQKNLSQGDIEKRTGLFCCYTSRVENGHTDPSIETLEKLAHALEIPLYQLFYDGEKPPEPPELPKHQRGKAERGQSGKDAKTIARFRKLLGRIDEKDQRLLFSTAQKMAGSKKRTAYLLTFNQAKSARGEAPLAAVLNSVWH
jgi:transcriptional regulator with XRE-family HTH domain